MPVCRSNKKSDFTAVDNGYLRERNLSLQAKGLLTLVFSLPEDWDIRPASLASVSVEDKKGIRAVLRELEGAGYLVREQERGETGRLIRSVYRVYERPADKSVYDLWAAPGRRQWRR